MMHNLTKRLNIYISNEDKEYSSDKQMMSRISLTLKLLAIFILTIFFSYLSTSDVSAATFNLSGNISESSGNDVSGVTIEVIVPGTNTVVGNTISDVSGNYSLVVNEGAYNVQVAPPSGSNFSLSK